MSFTIPAFGAFPRRLFYALTALGHIRSGDSTDSGIKGVLLADRWVRAHAMRVFFSHGREHDVSAPTYEPYTDSAGFILEEGEGVDLVWDAIATTGTTNVRVTLTYSSSGLTDTQTVSTSGAARTVRKDALVLVNYTGGEVTISIDVSNTSSDGTMHGCALQGRSLSLL